MESLILEDEEIKSILLPFKVSMLEIDLKKAQAGEKPGYRDIDDPSSVDDDNTMSYDGLSGLHIPKPPPLLKPGSFYFNPSLDMKKEKPVLLDLSFEKEQESPLPLVPNTAKNNKKKEFIIEEFDIEDQQVLD